MDGSSKPRSLLELRPRKRSESKAPKGHLLSLCAFSERANPVPMVDKVWVIADNLVRYDEQPIQSDKRMEILGL